MSNTASQLAVQHNHPWAETLRALADLEVGAIVVRVDHLRETEAAVQNTLRAASQDESWLSMSGHFKEIFGRLSVIDHCSKTLDLLNGLDAINGDHVTASLEFDDVTRLFTGRIIEMSPSDWADVLAAICQGEGQFILKAASEFKPIRAFIHNRLHVGNSIQSLISLRPVEDSFPRSDASPTQSQTVREPMQIVAEAVEPEMQRLAMVGKISSHIIHEINNPVTVINGKAEKIQWLLDSLPEGDGRKKLNESVVKILEMTDRINKIIRGMKNLTRNNAAEPFVSTKVIDLVRDVFDLVDVLAKKHNVLVREPVITGDLAIPMRRLRLSQLLVNLLSNGIDAVASCKERWVEIQVSNDDGWLYLRVGDSGSGVPESVRARLFEAYFSTKGAGQGNGIGLSLSRDIAREHGGDLYLDATAKNTCFVVKLPMKGLKPEPEADDKG
jgi:signal transduction histidine kinase